jgi:hypothetical protein
MRTLLLLCIFCFFAPKTPTLLAQTGCPGCAISVPPSLPDDTLYLQNIPDGEQGKPYDEDVSFRMPMTTTPVNAVDGVTPPGLDISQIEIVAVEGMPPGLYWQANQMEFQTGDGETDGCIKICGTPYVSDSFVLTVRVRATVFFLSQEASFPMRFYIAPPVSNTDGFSMTNFTGCGAVEVSFENNLPSGGNPGFTYQWDFGNGSTFNGENPPPQRYDEPGVYPVSYTARIDTAGFRLVSITVQAVDCVDQLGVGSPDLYVLVESPSGQTIFNSSPYVNNTPLPYTFPVGLQLGDGNYTVAVWDEDGGLKGGDDPCGSIPFNYLSNGQLSAGGLTVILNIVHPITEVISRDTVFVYAQPPAPTISAPDGLEACAGDETLILMSSYGAGNQWFMDGQPIGNANAFIYEPTETGYYHVQISTQEGCSVGSDSVWVQYFEQPALPAFVNLNNSLRLFDTLALPAEYSLQWYNGDSPIPGETGFRYCATTSGNYGLLVTDEATGCSNFYVQTVVHNPNFDCTVGTDAPAPGFARLFPNPASDWLRLEWAEPLSDEATLRLWDATGRLLRQMPVPAGQQFLELRLDGLPYGLLSLELHTAQGVLNGRVVLSSKW